jgi:hypothetical protein
MALAASEAHRKAIPHFRGNGGRYRIDASFLCLLREPHRLFTRVLHLTNRYTGRIETTHRRPLVGMQKVTSTSNTAPGDVLTNTWHRRSLSPVATQMVDHRDEFAEFLTLDAPFRL